jgi:methyl-accepting chemotaxis protein
MINVSDLNDYTLADPRLTELSRIAGGLGREIVDVAGVLDQVEASATNQMESLRGVREAAAEVTRGNDAVRAALSEARSSTSEALEAVQGSSEMIRSAGDETRAVATWVRALVERMRSIEELLGAVEQNNRDIASIASQVNILAINAKIEAARAGDAGRGFAVVAEAINELSRKTARAAEGIEGSVTQLSGWIGELAAESADVGGQADRVLDGAEETDAALSRVSGLVSQSDSSTRSMVEATQVVESAVCAFGPAFDRIGAAAEETASEIAASRKRAHALIDASERIVVSTVLLGGSSIDSEYIERVRADAATVSQHFEAALASGEISKSDLFSDRYVPIPGSNPEQVAAPFTEFTDRVLPRIQESALELDEVIFCAAVDRNGYLPTHNRKFSQPQGADPVWNAANCRNRRIFNDRVGLKAGRSKEPFLLQVYRRDMGGGVFRMMKDVSAPIIVNGRHWGGLRLAYGFRS